MKAREYFYDGALHGESWVIKCYKCGEYYRTTCATKREFERIEYQGVTALFPRLVVVSEPHRCKRGSASVEI